ncbi:hypothetical protein VDIAB_110159 [Vibrio diabolicus]|nr:hypothetical protein VDIAB_110159 [Vibrio diabolicus]
MTNKAIAYWNNANVVEETPKLMLAIWAKLFTMANAKPAVSIQDAP